MATKTEAKENPSTDLQKSYIAVVAIDFGTSYTGFAFSFNKGQQKDAIFMNKDWRNEQGCSTKKAPTCLLLTPDLTFDSFGYDAIENYAQLKLENERNEQEYFFFQHFKMALHSDKNLNLETSLQAANGKRIKAKTVFAHSIKFMKDEAIKLIADETGDQHFKAEDIQWVLTVPAIWTPGAKQFMREAAYEADVGSMTNPGQLIIALEPETAALFCMERKMSHLEIERGSNVDDTVLSQPHTQYMVVDIGGGTLDVAIHEINDDGSIKEIDKITGGPYGGINVNREFERLLDELFGAENLKRYKDQHPYDWLAMMNDFEGKKQGLRILEGRETRIRLSQTFAALVRRYQSSASMKHYGVKLRPDYLCLSQNAMKTLFEPVMSSIKEHLKTLQVRPQLSRIQAMLLVGGFANSALLREELMNEFSHKYRVLIPRDAAISVVQGAVLFGKNPDKITERVVSTTYGADCSRDFDRTVHPSEHLFFADGRQKCNKLFNRFIKENDIARSGESIKDMYSPLRANDTKLTFGFYVTRNPECKFITDEGVTKIGSVTVQSPDTSKGRDRKIEVSMHFGGTEIVATAVDISSGSTAQTTLDFFHK